MPLHSLFVLSSALMFFTQIEVKKYEEDLILRVLKLCYLRNVNKIKSTVWRSYFSFFRGIKSANIEIFKDFYNVEKMEKNKSDDGLYFVIVP